MKELTVHTGYRSEVLELKHMLNQFSLSLRTKDFVTKQNLNLFHTYSTDSVFSLPNRCMNEKKAGALRQ